MSTTPEDIKVQQDAKRQAEKQAAKQENRARGRKVARTARTLSTGKRGRPVSLAVDVRVPTLAIADTLLAFVTEQAKNAGSNYAERAKSEQDATVKAVLQQMARDAGADWTAFAANLRNSMTATREKIAEHNK